MDLAQRVHLRAAKKYQGNISILFSVHKFDHNFDATLGWENKLNFILLAFQNQLESGAMLLPKAAAKPNLT